MARVLILAPHVDDELIGCYSHINDLDNEVDVAYFYELSQERLAEARAASKALGFRIINEGDITPAHYDTILVPSRQDWHADHKAVNRRYRHIATHFYSVDMGSGGLLPDAELKLDLLNLLYPSQKTLWEGNSKYWLFEDIQETDYHKYAKLAIGGVVCTVLETYAPLVYELRSPDFVKRLQNMDRSAVDAILSICLDGKVTLEYEGTILEA